MIGTSCNEKNCPGWAAALLTGVIAYVVMMVMFIKDVQADVRVEIIRELPNEKQIIVQTFDDEEVFSMWFTTKLEEGCDPYVTNVNIDRAYNPQDKGGVLYNNKK